MPKRPIGFVPPETAPLFVRIPLEVAEELDQASFELRRPKQELVAEAIRVLAGDDWTLGRHSFAPADAPEVLTAEQLAEFLQVDVTTVRELAARGGLPGRKVGRQWRFSRRAVLDWLAADQAASSR